MDVALITLYIPLIAVALDLILADPAGLPHPVRWIGRILEKIEPRLRGMGFSLKTAGILAAVVLCLVVFIVVRLVCAIPVLGVLVALYLAWTGLALGGLLKEGRKVARLVDEGRIDEAREALALLVSRDTTDMDAAKIRSSLAETVSENLNDGFVAPFMFLCIFGPAGMWVYKTISTMDSMWGYKTEEYKELGWFAARADDVLAFIPARVTAFLMLGAGWFLKLDVNGAYDHMREDAQKSESPNAGWPMAAASWLIGAAVGGPTAYFGEVKDKPQIGPDGEWDAEKILRLLRLTMYSGILGAVAVAPVFLPGVPGQIDAEVSSPHRGSGRGARRPWPDQGRRLFRRPSPEPDGRGFHGAHGGRGASVPGSPFLPVLPGPRPAPRPGGPGTGRPGALPEISTLNIESPLGLYRTKSESGHGRYFKRPPPAMGREADNKKV